MTFDKLHNGIKCNCINNAKNDFHNEYVRKLRKDELSDKDFLTHWERGIGTEETECDNICSYKGISINQINEDSEPLIIERYKTTFNINPKKGAYFLKFKVKEKAGKVEHAPLEDDDTHYNFFKSDEFDLNSLEVIKTVKFA
tara:strand:+ start:63 stop:488 length:426 start_codon:yes stop_codon:yes gene_type:complete